MSLEINRHASGRKIHGVVKYLMPFGYTFHNKSFSVGLSSLIGVLLVVLLSCGQARVSEQKSEVPTFFQSDSEGTVATDISSEYLPAEGGEIVPKIPVGADRALVALVNVNFDLEKNEEQVLATKQRERADSIIRVVVVAYDSVRQSYEIAFESETKSVNPRAFSLSFHDIVGDHNLEIICRGIDGESKQTLDVFHRTRSPSGYGLFYSRIFSIALQGSIEIIELERSGTYQTGYTNGAAFPIVTQTLDDESDNILDLVQKTYYWRFSEEKYVEGKVEKVPGEEVEQQQLRDLYRRNAAAFEEFLNGSWYFTGDESVSAPIILNFSLEDKIFTYFTGELQEAYRWLSTYKVLSNRVEINGDNELVPFIKKQFYIQVETLDTMRIRGSDPWHGLYQKLSSPIGQEFRSDLAVIPPLSGYFYSDAGNELHFDGNSFRLVEGSDVKTGGYAIYSAGANVLELRVLNAAGLVEESRRFRIDYAEEKRDERIYRTLFLIPGIVGIYGFEATEDTFIRFEQIETVDEGAGEGAVQ
ncbi:MAG: hypothetical protein CMN78_01400 [Spirochaetales bacterium]|nr:hypothetical protein [Spirochaetales bacterium]